MTLPLPGQRPSLAVAQIMCNNEVGYDGGTGSGSTVSGTAANLPTSVAITLNKRGGSGITQLWVDLHVAGLGCNTSNSIVEFGVVVNSVYYQAAQFNFINLGNYKGTRGGFYISAGLAAGAYSCTVQWKRTGGAGTITLDGNSRIYLAVAEVYT